MVLHTHSNTSDAESLQLCARLTADRGFWTGQLSKMEGGKHSWVCCCCYCCQVQQPGWATAATALQVSVMDTTLKRVWK